MINDEKLKTILKKDGRDWTSDEGKYVFTFVKKHGRAALKALRKDLGGGKQ